MSKAKLPNLSRIIELQSLLQNFHYIKRVVHLSATSERLETDTEHSYTLALIAWYLAQYFAELDTNLCIRYALAHDLIELHAGDTHIFDQEMLKTKVEREEKALIKLENDWSDFKELTIDIHNYKDLSTPESCFIYALDKIMPIITIYLSKGKTWHNYKISLEALKENKKLKVMKSPQILHYYEELIALLEKYPEYFPNTTE